MLYPENFEYKTGFFKIKKLIKSYCISKLGKSKTDEINFLSDIEIIKTKLKQTEEFKNIVLFCDNFPVSYYIDVNQYFERTQDFGAYFIQEELLDLKNSLDTIKAVLNFFKNDEENKYPELKKLAKKIVFFPFVVSRINSVIDKRGKIKNNASKTLASIRKDLSGKESGVSRIMHRILNNAKSNGYVNTDTELTIRDGKLLIPVQAADKRKINGYVYDESTSGQTSYIEPIEIIRINNEIKELIFAERREIIKILIAATNDIKPYFDDLKLSYDFLAEIDFIRAKAKFSIITKAESPSINETTNIDFRRAKHPLLFISHSKTNKEVIPSDFKINENRRIILISGPNAGGKSVALKTVALLQYMTQCGIQIPVHQSSQTGIFNKIFIDIGDEQSIENDLSTYSSHLVNMKFFTENTDSETLIFIDEFGTGTEPSLGGAIAEAVLEKINKNKTKGIITTHYTNLKQFADRTEGLINAAMLFDSDKMQPLYRLETGEPGSSFAFEIAENTGLERKILENAKSKIDEKQLDFENILKKTQREKRNLKSSKRKIRSLKIQLEDTIEKYETEIDTILNQKKEILKKAQNNAEEILKSANKKIEQTIFEIKKSNAEKEKTKELRRKLDDFKKEQEEKKQKEQEDINRKIRKLNKKRENRKRKKITENKPVRLISKKIGIGDIVKIKGQNTNCEVIGINGNIIEVAFESMTMKVKKEQLDKLHNAKNRKQQQKTAINIVRNNENTFGDSLIFGLDLRGKRGDEALHTVVKFIDEAIISQKQEVKILHGTGSGILKQIIRDYLRTQYVVKSYKDERVEEGGAGVTVVKLNV